MIHGKGIDRAIAFVRDFLPERAEHLIFPISSALLLAGAWLTWSPIYPSKEIALVAATAWTSSQKLMNMGIALGNSVKNTTILWAAFGSFLLTVLRSKHTFRKFGTWVFLPIGAGIVGFWLPVLISLTSIGPVLGNGYQRFRWALSQFPSILAHAGLGFRCTILGTLTLAVALWNTHRGWLQLPVTFGRHGRVERPAPGDLNSNRDILTFLAALLLLPYLAYLLSLPLLWRFYSRGLFPSWRPGDFSAWEWVPRLAELPQLSR